MSKKAIITIVIAVVILVVAGGWFWYGEKQKPVREPVVQNGAEQVDDNQPVLDAESEISNQQSEIDMSDWLTYRNEEYGFEVRYPEGWSKNDYINDPLFIKFTRYNESPSVLTENEYAMTLTKMKLDQMKKIIESSVDNDIFLLDNKVKARLDINYEVPSGSFYKKIQFFIGNDLIELGVTYPLGPYTWPDDKNTINNLLPQINTNSLDKRISDINHIFQQIVETINFFSSV